MQVTQEEIAVIAQLVDELCGVMLDETKGYLIEGRLGDLVERWGSTSFGAFCDEARASRLLQNQIIDAITTNETLFFRDASPFEALKHKVIPETIDAKVDSAFPKRLRIWSAACSTGQEPYSMAMVLADLLPDIGSWDVNILGTDISNAAIKRASLGLYSTHEVRRGMPPEMLAKHFQEEPGGWRVKDTLRYMIAFGRRNLLEPFTGLGPFDVIFCRNVAIYFETDIKRDLFSRLADRLTPDGYLIAGAAESLDLLDPRFVPERHCGAIYYRPNKASG
ncbi:MAG: protein-glutamate O-methyltransferase CheR [bacterium]|nr:protein-glutamate O-methyltransferase CheR [bacterium]